MFNFPCKKTRREFLWQAGNGFFGTAMAYMLASDGFGAKAQASALTPGSIATPRSLAPHFKARAKSVIFLYMVGGPAHMDTFDPKPILAKRHGEKYDFKTNGTVTQKAAGQLKGSPFTFHKRGKSGIEISEVFPHLGNVADELAIIRSTTADSSAHGSASLQMNTGHLRQGLPSMGSWATYGLGSVNSNMPGFVVLVNGAPYSGATNWSAGFMPAEYQGTVFNITGDPISNLASTKGVTPTEQRRRLDLLAQLNASHLQSCPMNDELAARIESYELAFRMQSHAPEAVDFAKESEATKSLYGIGAGETDRFGRSCLMARRLVERGVRFVQIYHSNWDTHGDNDARHRKLCGQTDKPMAGLIADLKQRGLLDDTLIIWAGEFGRTPIGGVEKNGGRDHHAVAFSTFLAGGGVKGGQAYGSTDDFGFAVTENKVHVHDLHATILHLMGMDHEKLTFRHQNRDFRLTDVSGEVVKALIA
jgi:hypothetical protein